MFNLYLINQFRTNLLQRYGNVREVRQYFQAL